MAHTDSTTPSDVRPQAPVGDTPGTSDRGQTPQPAHKYRFPTLVDLLALVGIWYLLQFVGLLAARLAGFDFPDWDLLRGNVAPTPEQQDALARFTAFTYLVTMGLMILFTLFYRRLRHGTRKTLRFSARGLNPVLLLWGLVMMLAAGIVIEPVVELLPMPSSAVYGRGFWAIITLVVMAPLLEEFLCRGIILESVRAKYGVVAALFLSSAFFAVLHGHPALAVNAFVMGLILGFIYIETNSIFSVVLLHAMNNGAAFLLIMVGLDGATIRSVIGSDTLYTIVYVVALVLFAASGYMIYRLLARAKKLDKNTIR